MGEDGSQGLAVLVGFIAVEMILAQLLHVPAAVSPGAITVIITAAVSKVRRLPT